MDVYPLIVAQYAIEGHIRRTEHWGLVVLESSNVGHVFELVGNTDTFAYQTKLSPRFQSPTA